MKRFILGACAALVATPAMAATVTNASFETGDMTGWSAYGLTSVGTQGATDGTFAANISNAYPQAVGEVSLLASLGITQPSGSGWATAFIGSAIQTTVTVGIASTVYFDWQFSTTEYSASSIASGGPYQDFAFVAVDSNVFVFVRVPGPAVPPPGLFDVHSSSIPMALGTHTLTFGVFNVGDSAAPSSVTIDNVRTVPVPLPAAIWAGLPMLGLMGVMAKRRRHSSQS